MNHESCGEMFASGATRIVLFFATALLLVGTAQAPAGVIYVDAGAIGQNNGTSWTDAFVDLQLGLTAAQNGDELWVAAATYTPGPPGDAVSSFQLQNGVGLYGGFAGTETFRDQRDWIAHPTILSGDVGHDDVYGNPWYVGWNIVTANSGHVVDGSGVDASAVIDGFHVTAGHTGPVGTPAGDPLMYGSGLFIVGGSPTVRHCTFSRNLAAFAAGGAVYCQDASPSITHCTFTQNYVHLGNGAGIAVVGNAAPMISDCNFTENQAVCEGGNTGQGSGISVNFITSPLSITIERCRFEYNVARTFYSAGGVEIARGGGISNFGASLTVRDCVFRHNSANAGAGVQTWSPTILVNCLFFGNTVYSHDSGAGSDGGYGAGVCLYSFQPITASVVNCTIVKNNGSEGVGMQSLANAQFLIRNSVVWGNLATGGDVSPLDAQLKGDFSGEFSCIQDLLTPIPGEDPPDPAKYPGCIVVNPEFVDQNAGDLHLAPGSPCVDAARNADVPAGVTLDLDSHVRFLDDPAMPDTGAGTPPIVDMGAYEFVPNVVGDVDCDGNLDWDDMGALVAVLLGLDDSPCHFAAADLNDDGKGDGLDIQPFVNALLTQ